MPRHSLSQSSFFDPEFVCPAALLVGTVPWLLARWRSRLFPRWLMAGWRGEGAGRNAWPAEVLVTLLFLRWCGEGMSRRGSVRRAMTDAEWRAAMGLAMDTRVPDERTVRDFEKWLGRRHACGAPRYLVLHEHVVRLCVDAGVVGSDAVWATDSTPMWCYGAVLDTIRLMGDGLRSLGLLWARATRQNVEQVATTWDLPLLLAKSTKGAMSIDWRDKNARATAVAELAEHVLRVAADVRRRLNEARPAFRRKLLHRCRLLVRVVRDDLEYDEQGRLVIAKKVAQDRLVSFTDPQARHGRKSKSKTFKGFKLHVLGDVVSGLIASVAVTSGNVHDGQPAQRLIRRAKAMFDDIELVLGDTAYGGMRLRHAVDRLENVSLLAPPVKPTPSKGACFPKELFEIDFERREATCPDGVVVGEPRWTRYKCNYEGAPALRFAWSKATCQTCSLRSNCLGKRGGGRTLTLHPHEQRLREVRAEWAKPEVRAAYRTRTQCERLVNRLTRHGARQARAWGLGAANLQAHVIAATCNLALLAQAVAAELSQPNQRAA